MNYKDKTIEFLAENLDLSKDTLESLIEIPPQKEMGDFAIPCFQFAKQFRKNPALIAKDFAEKLNADLAEFIEKIEVKGPYLNIFLDRPKFNESIIKTILSDDKDFLKPNLGHQEKVLVEFSSPNIAKPFHVGHAYSTILGDVLANLYSAANYDVERLNHIGDYGTQFGKLIVAFDNWGDKEALKDEPITELTRVYTKFHKEAETQPELEDEARKAFHNLELGEEHELNLWKIFRNVSLAEFKKTYERLNISFDSYIGEAFYAPKLNDVIKLLEDKGLVEESQGALVVPLDDLNMPPCIVRKSDGSSIYATRDIAAALYRHKEYDFDQLIYVVGLPQELHFRQFFAVLKKAGFDFADDMYFVGFGTVKFPGDVKLSTRSGNVIYLKDLLDEAVHKTKEIIIENNKDREDKMSTEEIDKAAEAIGIAAVKYTFLRNGRENDIIFEWDEILDFEGDTAPYMQYTYARAKSILRNADVDLDSLEDVDLSVLTEDAEYNLCTEINLLPEAIAQALKDNEPANFARQVMSACRSFNKFYNQISILQADTEDLKMARLALSYAFSKVIKKALALLGIETVERM